MKTVIYNGKVYIQRDYFEEAILISDGIIEKLELTKKFYP